VPPYVPNGFWRIGGNSIGKKRFCERIIVTGVPRGFFACIDLRMGDAHVAQLVERILGKDEVSSSNLLMGSINLV
jgi:hypothetical protein